LDARAGIELIKSGYDDDYLHTQALYCWGNLQGWRGEEARATKKELREIAKGVRKDG
jgi:hypothetical protein